jgi:hypothetical protein
MKMSVRLVSCIISDVNESPTRDESSILSQVTGKWDFSDRRDNKRQDNLDVDAGNNRVITMEGRSQDNLKCTQLRFT